MDYRHIVKYIMLKHQNNIGESKQYNIEWKEITYRMMLFFKQNLISKQNNIFETIYNFIYAHI